MLKTKSVYYDKIERGDGTRILVMRYWCRPLSKEKAKVDEWIKELAPSKELHRDYYAKNIDFAEYVQRYFKEIEAQKSIIKELARRSITETITLLCFEKTDERCHRRLLKELIEKKYLQ